MDHLPFPSQCEWSHLNTWPALAGAPRGLWEQTRGRITCPASPPHAPSGLGTSAPLSSLGTDTLVHTSSAPLHSDTTEDRGCAHRRNAPDAGNRKNSPMQVEPWPARSNSLPVPTPISPNLSHTLPSHRSSLLLCSHTIAPCGSPQGPPSSSRIS